MGLSMQLAVLLTLAAGEIAGAPAPDWRLEGADARIRQHRMGEVVLELVLPDGSLAPKGSTVSFEQTRHAFHFGASLTQDWSLHKHPEYETYLEHFDHLFNYATLGFYWDWHEREKAGDWNLAKHQVDALAWAKERGMTTKGHPLMWSSCLPAFVRDEPDVQKIDTLVLDHVRMLARDYPQIDQWDLYNETPGIRYKPEENGARRWVEHTGGTGPATKSIVDAVRAVQPEGFFMLNHFTHNDPEYDEQIAWCQANGVRFDAIGVQSHMHTRTRTLSEEEAWLTLEKYASYGSPVHLSEITVLSSEPFNDWRDLQAMEDDILKALQAGKDPPFRPSTPEGEARQAQYVRDFYTLAFSHPAVDAIVWWNLADVGAWRGSAGGLLDTAMKPKPAYKALDELINHQWRTSLEGKTNEDGRVSLHGFYGEYRLSLTHEGNRLEGTFRLEKGSPPSARVSLAPSALAEGPSPMPLAKRPLPTRQIHLDFHTSEHIPDIGAAFDKAQWQEALRVGHVNSINIFAKGHHSWSYYPTKVGKVHPNLDFDLLGAQVEACHEMGVECPFYFTVGWSATDAEEHPEWCARRKDGGFVWPGRTNAKPDDAYPTFAWKLLCPSGEYHDHIMAQVEEICESYDMDGFWFDIYQLRHGCWCERCMASMKEKGVNTEDNDAVVRHFAGVYKRHMKALRELIAQYHPEATIFFNGTVHIDRHNHASRVYEYNTHQDLEDLPTGWGGYDKFPYRAKYYAGQGFQVAAMSGKFHTAWGEFGGFKHPDAIKFEAASMIAYGAACNFGDQLHPNGLMDMQTYRNIGEAFAYVEQIEEYGPGGDYAANLGLWMSNDIEADEGAYRMLLEVQMDFLIANEDNLDEFEAVVIPSAPCLDEDDVQAIERFIADGGGVLALAQGAMDASRSKFILDVGASYAGPARYDIDYSVAGDGLGEGLMKSPVLMYAPALRVTPDEGTEVLATIYEPYFSRTYAHYTSHQNTPYQPEPAEHPALIRKGNVIFAAHALDRNYLRRAARPHRDLFERAVRLLTPNPMLKTDLPSAGRVSLLHQPDEKRYVAHLLYATPHYRGDLELIEDLVPLYDIPVAIRVPEGVTKATLIPDNVQLDLKRDGDYVSVTVPEFTMHCAVVFSY
jgi:GH35 family endo-1,4-beta-xylanase